MGERFARSFGSRGYKTSCGMLGMREGGEMGDYLKSSNSGVFISNCEGVKEHREK